MSFGQFRVSITSASTSSVPSRTHLPDPATSAPTSVKFRDPATFRAPGSFEWDKSVGGYGGRMGNGNG
ncbi:hypothetical protein FA95DRAFT_1565960, partial [Auriscalpium vulgare]